MKNLVIGILAHVDAGKTTLIDMILDPEKYLYDGKIIISEESRIGYVNQFSSDDKDKEKTVFEFLSEKFVENQKQTEEVCAKMAVEEDLEPLYEEYHNVNLSENIINNIIELTEKYIYDRFRPDKQIDILDEVCSKVNIKENYKNLKEEIKLKEIKYQKEQ